MRCASFAFRRICRAASLCLTAVLIVSAAGPSPAAAPATDPRASTAMQLFFDRATAARQYSAARRLEASGRGHTAWLDVQTEFTAASGFAYQVTDEGGSGFIRSRVLRSLLDEEQRLIARGDQASVALSTANYEFIPEGIDEHGFATVSMRPLRRERSLIDGRMLLTPEGELVRVEGQLAKNPSFWTTRVNVVRSYRRINDVQMPIALETTSRIRFLGASDLRMTYRYAEIDDRPVMEESTAPGSTAAGAAPCSSCERARENHP